MAEILLDFDEFVSTYGQEDAAAEETQAKRPIEEETQVKKAVKDEENKVRFYDDPNDPNDISRFTKRPAYKDNFNIDRFRELDDEIRNRQFNINRARLLEKNINPKYLLNQGYTEEQVEEIMDNFGKIKDILKDYNYTFDDFFHYFKINSDVLPDDLLEKVDNVLDHRFIGNEGFNIDDLFEKREDADFTARDINPKELKKRGFNTQQIKSIESNFADFNDIINRYGYSFDEFKELYENDALPDDIIFDVFEESPLEFKNDITLEGFDTTEFEKNVNNNVPELTKEQLDKISREVTFDDINQNGYKSGFRRNRNFSEGGAVDEETIFERDEKPADSIRDLVGHNALENLFYSDFAAYKTGQGIDQLFSEVKNIYQTKRNKLEVERHGKQIDRNRRVLGIVYDGESRDNLVANNKLPAYYSTSNIQRLLRNGIMPVGWNEEMAVQQGFGKEISNVKFKEETKNKAREFLRRETTKAHVKATEGDLKNLRNRLKSRKLAQYFSQF